MWTSHSYFLSLKGQKTKRKGLTDLTKQTLKIAMLKKKKKGRQKEKNCCVKKISRTKSKANNKSGRDVQTKLIVIVSKSNNEKYLYEICDDMCSGILREAYSSVKQAGAPSTTEPRTRPAAHPSTEPGPWRTDDALSVTAQKAVVSRCAQVGSHICVPYLTEALVHTKLLKDHAPSCEAVLSEAQREGREGIPPRLVICYFPDFCVCLLALQHI